MKQVILIMLCFTVLAFGQTHSVSLNWTASPTQGVTYSVYRYTKSNPCAAGRKPYHSNITSTNFTDTFVKNGATYYYGVTAVLNGQSSACSNIVQAVIP